MTPITYATINLAALKHNFNVAKTCACGAKIIAVIKANAYGHGLLQIAEALKSADAFAVSRIDEALLLRQAGFKQRCIILEGFFNEEGLKACFLHKFEPVVHCIEQLKLLEYYAPLKDVSLWLKLDSGMNRLGFKSDDFRLIYARLNACVEQKSQLYFMTHLASADDLNDPKTLIQIRLFNATVKPFKHRCSIANSAGLLMWNDALADWVRPGLMLYGMSPIIGKTAQQLNLRPVMSLYSELIAIKTVKAGETIGYGGRWTASKKTRLGVVAIGYGDGYPRHASVGTPVLINGAKVPLVGRVSMDMLTVDLSSQSQVNVGDKVTLWGKALAIEDIAESANTIAYTLVCGITARVPRCY